MILFFFSFFRRQNPSSFDLHLSLSSTLSCLLYYSTQKNSSHSCDTTVHGANEATAKHLRLPLPQFSLGFKALSSSSGGGGGEKDTGAAAASAAAAAAATEAKGKGRAASPEQQAKAAAAAAQAALLQQRASAQAAAAAQRQASEQQQQANGNGDNNPYGDLWAPSAPGMTLAAELLGLPPDAVGDFSAKDVDAAYMLADADGGTDFDADLSAILEVPDIDFLPPPAAAGGGGASGSGALPPPPVPQAFYSSNDNGAGPSNAPAPPAGGGGGGGRGSRRGGGGGANGGGGGGEVDGVVPELLPKRARR